MELLDPMPDSSFNGYEDIQQGLIQRSSVILIVTRNGHLSEKLMNYALEVAGRLQCAVLVAYINTMPRLWDGGRRIRRFNSAVEKSFTELTSRACATGITVSHVKESGRIRKVVHRLCLLVRKVSFVVVDEGVRIDDAEQGASVPVFSIGGDGGVAARVLRRQKRNTLNIDDLEIEDKKVVGEYVKMICYGLLAIVLYWLFFTNSKAIVQCWSAGGLYAILPLLTVCVFYYVQQLFLDGLISFVFEKNSETGKIPIRQGEGRKRGAGAMKVATKRIGR